MKSFIIGLCLIACLSFELGQALECYTCGSIAYLEIDEGNCNGDLSKVTCGANKTNCGKVELAGTSAVTTSTTFTYTLRGCTSVEVNGDTCSKEPTKAAEIQDDIGIEGFDNAAYVAFQGITGTSPSYSSVAACTCTDELCNSAGSVQTSTMVICGSLLMAVLAKLF